MRILREFGLIVLSNIGSTHLINSTMKHQTHNTGNLLILKILVQTKKNYTKLTPMVRLYNRAYRLMYQLSVILNSDKLLKRKNPALLSRNIQFKDNSIVVGLSQARISTLFL